MPEVPLINYLKRVIYIISYKMLQVAEAVNCTFGSFIKI